MSFSNGKTDMKQNKQEKAFRHYALTHAGNLKFRFQHGPFTKRFRPVVTRVPAVVLSCVDSPDSQSHVLGFSHLPNDIRGDGDLHPLWPASSENVLVTLLLLHCGQCLWDWTLPHGSRKQQTNVCTD